MNEKEVVDSAAETSQPAKKKAWYSQHFNEEWLVNTHFKDWLRQDKRDKNLSYCICCNCKFKNPNKSMLNRHLISDKHKKNFESAKATMKISSFLSSKKATTQKEQVAKAELLIAGYFSEHHLPFSSVDHLTDVLKRSFPDSEIAQNLALKRTKLSYLIQDGIAFHEKMDLSVICQNQKFSLLIDESTDISVTQILAIVVRYFDVQKQDVSDALLDAVEVEDGKAQGLYSAVKSVFVEQGIPLSNVIGFGSDNCSTMMGSKSGFQKLLKDDNPSVFILGCVCHSFALCASHAVSKLPSYLETFLKDLTSYFSRSSKRQNDFSLIQEVCQTSQHKIPKLAHTRWLSRANVIREILDQWDALTLYFQSESTADKIDGASNIYSTMVNRGTKHMLLFLQYVLEKVNTLNVEFQSEHFRLHLLHLMVSTEYRNILSLFIQDQVLDSQKLSCIDPSDVAVHKHVDEIYLGGRAMTLLLKEPLDVGNETHVTQRFKKDCLHFLVELSLQIKKRFSLNDDDVIAEMKILNPEVAQDLSQSPASLAKVAIHFPSIVSEDKLNQLDDEWRSFRISKIDLSFAKSIPEYWYSLRNIKNALDIPKYALLSQFMTNLTVLPHSSACVERIFSHVNCVKTKFTNCLKPGTVRDRLLATQSIKRNNMECTSWNPKQSLINDVADGVCNKRYKLRMKELKEQTFQHVSVVNDTDIADVFL